MRKGSEGAAGQTPSSLHSSSAQVSSKTDPRRSVYVCTRVSRQLGLTTKGDPEEPILRGRSCFLVLAAVKVF